MASPITRDFSLPRSITRKRSNVLNSNLSIKTAVSNEQLENQLKLWFASVSYFNEATGALEPVSPSQLNDLGNNGLWINITLSQSPKGDDLKSSQGVLHWLEVLRQKFQLPALSLVDIVNPEAPDPVKVDRVKIDDGSTCLYTSMVAYTSSTKRKAMGEAAEPYLQHAPSRGISHRDRHYHSDEGRLKSLVCEEAVPSWQRVGLFLTDSVLVTFFEDDLYDGPVVFDRIQSKGLLPGRSDFQYGLGFLYYKIVDAVIRLTPEVIKAYEKAICEVEKVALNASQRPTYQQDVVNTTQLHLMRNELAMIKHIVAPSQRVLTTILSEFTCESAGILGPVGVDYLEEVGDELNSVNEDIEVLIDNCEQISGLIFNLSSYNDAKNGSILTIMATIFLPLTWVCGIYGMNFDILPELHWKLGYLYFWMASLAIAIFTFVAVGFPLGYFHRMGLGLQPRIAKATEDTRKPAIVRRTVSNRDVSSASSPV